jgi:glutamate/tyrosine decarboxylase-like PLP-dependent enzyme
MTILEAGEEGAAAPLRLSPGQMRAVGYRAVDGIIQHLTMLESRPVGRVHHYEEIRKLLDPAIPAGPAAVEDVLDDALALIRATITHTDHPRFMAYVPGPSNYVGAIADFIASGLNVHAGAWVLGPGPAVIEQITVGWLSQLCGLPDTAGGLFVSGGSMASLVAIHAARFDRLGDNADGVIYLSTQTHASIRRGLRFLGLADRQIRVVDVDRQHRLHPGSLAAHIEEDFRRGLTPFCVVATAGATSTGAVDPLPAIAALCAERGLWLHVDAAYGAAAVITAQGKELLTGLERADSIAVDPHKWWFQPYEAGCVLVRDAATLKNAYHLHAEYLRETRLGSGPLNFYDLGPQLTRGFRALKLWLSLRTFGLDAFRRAVLHGLALAEHAQAVLNSRPHWQVVTPAQLAILTFRPCRPGLRESDVDALTRALAARTVEEGFGTVLSTDVDGRPVLRMCTIHPETTTAEITAIIDHLERLVLQLAACRT